MLCIMESFAALRHGWSVICQNCAQVQKTLLELWLRKMSAAFEDFIDRRVSEISEMVAMFRMYRTVQAAFSAILNFPTKCH